MIHSTPRSTSGYVNLGKEDLNKHGPARWERTDAVMVTVAVNRKSLPLLKPVSKTSWTLVWLYWKLPFWACAAWYAEVFRGRAVSQDRVESEKTGDVVVRRELKPKWVENMSLSKLRLTITSLGLTFSIMLKERNYLPGSKNCYRMVALPVNE